MLNSAERSKTNSTVNSDLFSIEKFFWRHRSLLLSNQIGELRFLIDRLIEYLYLICQKHKQTKRREKKKKKKFILNILFVYKIEKPNPSSR